MDKHQYEAYLKEKLHPLIERMLVDCLQHKPSDPIPYLIEWLQKEQKGDHNKAPESSQKPKKHAAARDEEKASSDEDDNDDYVDHVQTLKEKGKVVGRASVSAEAFGQYNQKKMFKPRVIPKKADQAERISKRLTQAFMFSALDQNEKKIVIDAMEEVKFKPGDWVIRQGDDGEVLYVVDEGELNCEKIFKKGDKPTFLKTYQPGESFGELALLYNAPRAASIQAKTNAILFALDRDTFNNIVKEAAAKKRERYEQFLTKVDILKQMDPYERSKIGDALVSINKKAGEFVVNEGESGDDFFMVEQGKLQALKLSKQNMVPVKDYQEGDYFGELALLKNVPRQATIKCLTDVKLVTLDRLAFKRLLGPIDAILARNAEAYKKFNQ